MIELYLLIGLMLIGSLVAVHTRYLLSAVISLGVVGLGLCVVFLFLQAPDLAITQILVEVLALVILIRATGLKRNLKDVGGIKEALAIEAVSIFIIGFAIFSFIALKELPPFGEPLMRVSQRYIEEGLKKTGSANLVTSVLLDFRAYDTLGEATVLFTAILGTLVVLRKRGRK